MALAVVTNAATSKNKDVLMSGGIVHTKHYALNIEKSLSKKLKCTKKKQITYKLTGGGFTAELDAVTFELFSHACESYYMSDTTTFQKVIKDNSCDRLGFMTQKTLKIRDSDSESYTVNLYITKCSILVNGRGAVNFIHRDIINLHEIIKNTTVNGLSVDIQQTNLLLSQQLETLLNGMKKNTKQNQQATETQLNEQNEKCTKCNRSCKTRAVLCKNNHWVHFHCEKLSVSEIEQIESNMNEVYTCSKCRIASETTCIKDTVISSPNIKQLAIPEPIKVIADQQTLSQSLEDTTLAQQLLHEEIMDKCTACLDTLSTDKMSCVICNAYFHKRCIHIESETCFSCVGTNDQILHNTSINLRYQNQTESTICHSIVTDRQETLHQHLVVTQTTMSATNKRPNTNNSTINENSNEIKQKELRQLELRLKKRKNNYE